MVNHDTIITVCKMEALDRIKESAEKYGHVNADYADGVLDMLGTCIEVFEDAEKADNRDHIINVLSKALDNAVGADHAEEYICTARRELDIRMHG